MMKKKKIREDFEKYFKEGNESMIKKMLEENPWLMNEWQRTMDQKFAEQSLVLAALGVMNDENGGEPVSIDDILYSLRVDFKVKKEEAEVKQLLNDAETLGYCKLIQGKWVLTPEGDSICDNYLNSHIDIIGPEIQ